MRKGQEIKVVVNKPNQENLEKLVAEAVAEVTIHRINKLPENQRLYMLEEIIKKLQAKNTSNW
ncbi:hypothetical protein [Natronincola ferrireducens]|uniref:Uncharacterized protein n=1 Tax=Natronincola ferrireducens TaxID=393762 RepID=A0A1G8ZDX2_9FIRM|nr:hypothetical protein [Natronincola ferrireducens]SDK13227.1 hypothetical protein SAMN05660472_00827 [Natronincola ferrireducens]